MIAQVNSTNNPNTVLVDSATRTFLPIPTFDMTFRMQAKVFRQEGDLKYEYNPFRNVFSKGEVENIANVDVTKDVGKLKDFRVKGLGFNLNNPIDMTIQPSYDGSVNVILNDDKNPPRIVNSRFTPTEDLTYKIVDRIGNNDTNVYQEEDIDQDTRLFMTSKNIPFIKYKGISEGGSAQVGNYTFYIKYCDADGNESDIIAESGMVHCHIGKINDPFSAKGGILNENSNKIVKLEINNLDTTYDYINIYFSRITGDYSEEPITKYYKLLNKKPISNQKTVEIIYTGFENVEEISIDELNIQYNIVDKVKTQAQVQNMLFLGNVDKPTIPYKELTDLSLRMYPMISNDKNIGLLDKDYKPIALSDQLDGYEYYDTNNVYNYTGYWDKEIYRFGVVYIMKDDSLSPVFNVRGRSRLTEITNPTATAKAQISTKYAHKTLKDAGGKRIYIETDNDGFISDPLAFDLENALGVVQIESNNASVTNTGIKPIGISFLVEKETVAAIKDLAKGFFFVRQKRIPTILAQGVTIGVDNISHTPTLFAKYRDSDGVTKEGYFTESFKSFISNEVVHDFTNRIITSSSAGPQGILCPEAILRAPVFNNFFTGALFNITPSNFTSNDRFFTQDGSNARHFHIANYVRSTRKGNMTKDVKLTLIEDNQPLKYSGTKRFSTRAGIPEEAWRTSFFGREDKTKDSKYLIRGAYTGFVGSEGYSYTTDVVDIHVTGYDKGLMRDYFLVRFNSSDSFSAISNRYDLDLLTVSTKPYENIVSDENIATGVKPTYYKFVEYRGDCFINTITTRVQRNFMDPEVPISDTIIDTFTWKDNYKGFSSNGAVNSEDLTKINRNDINAVEIGHWVTFKICSNINLAFRTTDESNSSEYALTGKYRSYYPISSMSTKGESKIPDSTLYNAGYSITVPSKLYYPLPDVPYIKNIFDTRIMFSDVHISDGFRNGYRIFQGLTYKDLTREYGGIVKLFNLRENLLCVFERGIGILQINREALVPTNEGDIFLKGIGVLPEKPQMLSDSYGSIWQDSIIRTEQWIYGVDTTAKKIWRTNGQDFQTISDFKVQKFLNDFIDLTENDKKPMVGLKNVKTHYNAFKKDVTFTFYDSTRDDDEVIWALSFNELTNNWTTRYSWTPLASENINNVWFTFDRESGKKLAFPGYTNYKNAEAIGITLQGKTETFTRTDPGGNVKRTITNGINIVSLSAHTIGTLKMKGYKYYDKYILKYFLTDGREDNTYFTIVGDKLNWKTVAAFPKYSYELQVRVELYSLQGGVEVKVQEFNDLLGVKVSRNLIWSQNNIARLEEYDTEFSTWFWKHGQAGVFDNSTEILPTKWYDKVEPFEYEFVVVDSPATHKIFDNLSIISNNAEPESFQFTVTKDVYKHDNLTAEFLNNHNNTQNTLIDAKMISTYQKALDIKLTGRRLGNMTYLENFWKVEIKPHRFEWGDKTKESRVRDKYCIIRVRYSGHKLALITALHTMYTISYA